MLIRPLTEDDADEAAAVVWRALAPGAGDLLLVKASRGIELDRLVDALREPSGSES